MHEQDIYRMQNMHHLHFHCAFAPLPMLVIFLRITIAVTVTIYSSTSSVMFCSLSGNLTLDAVSDPLRLLGAAPGQCSILDDHDGRSEVLILAHGVLAHKFIRARHRE